MVDWMDILRASWVFRLCAISFLGHIWEDVYNFYVDYAMLLIPHTKPT
jgi:hypothetical protein